MWQFSGGEGDRKHKQITTKHHWLPLQEKVTGLQQVEPCVVVFSYEASQRACALLADLDTRPRDKVVFVYSEQDVCSLAPDHPAYMVFIDYNECNTILEPEAGGYRALHLTTVKSLEQKAYGKFCYPGYS